MFSNIKSYTAIQANRIITTNKQVNIYTRLTDDIYYDRILVLGLRMLNLPLSYDKKKTPTNSYLNSVKKLINTNPLNTTRHLEALKQWIHIKEWVSLPNTLKDSYAPVIAGEKHSKRKFPTESKNIITKYILVRNQISGVSR